MTTPNGRSDRVARAVAIVSSDADCTVDEALLRMQERASANRQTLEEVAIDVAQELLRFEPDGRLTLTLPDAERRRHASNRAGRCS